MLNVINVIKYFETLFFKTINVHTFLLRVIIRISKCNFPEQSVKIWLHFLV